MSEQKEKKTAKKPEVRKREKKTERELTLCFTLNGENLSAPEKELAYLKIGHSVKAQKIMSFIRKGLTKADWQGAPSTETKPAREGIYSQIVRASEENPDVTVATIQKGFTTKSLFEAINADAYVEGDWLVIEDELFTLKVRETIEKLETAE